MKEALLDRRYFTRIPAQELLRSPDRTTDPLAHVSVARCREGSYTLLYTPMRQMLSIDTSGMDARRLRITVYDPEAGQPMRSWEMDNEGVLNYIPARQLDSFIVIDAI